KTNINGFVLWSVSFQDLVMFDPFYHDLAELCVKYWAPIRGINNIEPTNLIQTSDNGFLFSGRFKTSPNDMCLIKVDNTGDLLWTKNYQIKPNQRGCTIVDLIEANGGYAFILETWINQETITENWLVKTDNNGVVEWYKSFEETEDDRKLITLIQTAEGGYCLLGKSDVFYDEGYIRLEEASYGKINLIKADKNGNLEWLKNIDRIVIPSSSVLVKQTEKEEFILSGYFINEKTLGLMKLSTDGEQVIWEKSLDTPTYNEFSNSLLTEDEDIILVKNNGSETHLISLTDSGVKKWEKTCEGKLPFVENTKDMNIIIGGVYDFTTCVIKMNKTGSLIWKRVYPSPKDTEIVTQVLSTMDGGVMLYGLTNSFGAGKYNFWLVKIDSYGNAEWHKTFGNKYDQLPISILESNDGGYFFVGETKTVDVEYTDMFFFGKITNKGDLSWNLTIDFSNKTGDQRIRFIKQTTDEGYVIGGTSDLSPGYWADRTPNSWILKLNKHGLIQWKKDYWTSFPPIQTHDDGFIIITGFKESGSSANMRWLNKISKFNDSGDPQWEKTIRISNFIECKFISTPNSYFLIFNSDYRSSEMIKLNLNGEIEWQKNLPWGWVDYIFVRETNDGILVWSTRSEGSIRKYNLQGKIEWEEEYHSYIPNFNNSDSHLFCFNTSNGKYNLDDLRDCLSFTLSKLSTDGIQEWNSQTLSPMHVSRWTELSNGNIVIVRENTTLRDLHIITKTETIPCTHNFINNPSTTSVRTIVATPDGGCVVAGEKIISNNHPSRGIYLLKLNKNGLVEWIQTYAIENQIKGFLVKENFITAENEFDQIDSTYTSKSNQMDSTYTSKSEINFIFTLLPLSLVILKRKKKKKSRIKFD
ncbi:MAG: hypothetical protein ACFFDT_03265, partial [Candidatus Hodarchaeota archaeon]